MKVSELGEFALIDRLNRIIEKSGPKRSSARNDLLIGIGDDAAAWRTDGTVELATVDLSVEGVHFTLDTTPWGALGYKSLAISLSDIAAMGGTPRFALVSLALPGDTNVAHVETLYRGLTQIARTYRVTIAGGNTSSAPVVMIDTVVIGSAQSEDRIMTRSAARAGDEIAVTGTVGGAAAGYRMLTQGRRFDAGTTRALTYRFRRPEPRVGKGRLLSRLGVQAAIDISDGLVADLGHICRQSGVNAIVNVDLVPVNPSAKQAYPDLALELALSGGEDYELLFTAPPEIMRSLPKSPFPDMFTVIGRVVADTKPGVTLVDGKGRPYQQKAAGWEHFTSR